MRSVSVREVFLYTSVKVKLNNNKILPENARKRFSSVILNIINIKPVISNRFL